MALAEDGIRLNKYLASRGVASRRAVEELIRAGRVAMNGRTVLLPQLRVTPEDKVTVDGRRLTNDSKPVYYLLNKPVGYLCSNVRRTNERLVIDLFPEEERRLFTVGRLDKDTEGLLIVTNDGDFAHQVIHPSAQIAREYLAKVREEVTHEHLVALSRGTYVEGSWVAPTRITKMRRGTLRLTLYEGKKREVRQLIAAAGLELHRLVRIRLGGLLLGHLPVGHWRHLTAQDRDALLGVQPLMAS